MAGKYHPGDIIYIISAGNQIEEAKILKYSGGFYIIRFENGGGTRVRESRLFFTKEEAEAAIQNRTRKSWL